MYPSFNQSIYNVERLIIVEKENSLYSFLVDFTPVISGFILIVISVIQVVGLLDTYNRYEEYIAKKEAEFYEELSRNVEQYLHHHANTNNNINNNNNNSNNYSYRTIDL